MLTSKPKQLGFTIVELLIVIIVIAIAILATLVITAYNGVQQKAANTKTISAAEAWVKALRLYNADNNSWPVDACLGEDYPTGLEGSGTGKCYGGASYSDEDATFISQMQSYIGGGLFPSPDMQTIGDSSSWRRGILWRGPTSSYDLYVVQKNISVCPKLGGADYNSIISSLSGGIYCRYKVQPAS